MLPKSLRTHGAPRASPDESMSETAVSTVPVLVKRPHLRLPFVMHEIPNWPAAIGATPSCFGSVPNDVLVKAMKMEPVAFTWYSVTPMDEPAEMDSAHTATSSLS